MTCRSCRLAFRTTTCFSPCECGCPVLQHALPLFLLCSFKPGRAVMNGQIFQYQQRGPYSDPCCFPAKLRKVYGWLLVVSVPSYSKGCQFCLNDHKGAGVYDRCDNMWSGVKDVTTCDQVWKMCPVVTRSDRCDQLWPFGTGVSRRDQIGQVWLDVTYVTRCDQIWQDVSKYYMMWPDVTGVTRCDQVKQVWQDVTRIDQV